MVPNFYTPSFVSFGIEKNIINKKTTQKNLRSYVGVLIWVYKLAKKISSCVNIGGVYMLSQRYMCPFIEL